MDLTDRDPTVTYKVTHVSTQPLAYAVVRYPDYVEPNYSSSLYRFDALPGWMQDGIYKLDIAGNGTEVPQFGIKRGDTYWFKSVKYAAESQE